MQKLLHFWRKIYLCIPSPNISRFPVSQLPSRPLHPQSVASDLLFHWTFFVNFRDALLKGQCHEKSCTTEVLRRWITVDLNHQLHNMLFTFFWSAVKGILSRDGLDSSHRPHMSFTFSDQLLKCYNLFVVSIFAWFSWTAAVWTQV